MQNIISLKISSKTLLLTEGECVGASLLRKRKREKGFLIMSMMKAKRRKREMNKLK